MFKIKLLYMICFYYFQQIYLYISTVYFKQNQIMFSMYQLKTTVTVMFNKLNK